MDRIRFSAVVVVALLGTGGICAQSLADVAKKTQDDRAKADQSHPTEPPKVLTNKDLGPSAAGPESNNFDPTADNIFVCKARSLKALFKVVEAEHPSNGELTSRFADLKLQGDPKLLAAAKADAESCEKGTYVAAMENSLKEEADEALRLQGLLKRIP